MSWRRRDWLCATAAPLGWALAGCGTAPAAAPSPSGAPWGWAAVADRGDGGTTGGAPARPEHRFDVHDRAGLAAALRLGDTPKFIRLHTHIDLAADAQGRPQGPETWADPAFSWAAFEAAYDPSTWGRQAPKGPLEDARKRSAQRQAQAVVLRLPPNTTVVGVRPGAGFSNGMVLLENVHNVVLRHLVFRDAFDHFPAWDPNDNAHGEWNSEFDSLSLRNAQRVWVDHCAFDDGQRPDSAGRLALGRRLQHHDGLLDITKASDRVTVSFCRFHSHDKTMLIGSGDGQTADEGRLRVTLHHNHFHHCKERTPRVRFGQVHLFNNLFSADNAAEYAYSLGIGFRSKVVAEDNAWRLPAEVPAHQLLRVLKGTALAAQGHVLNGQPVDLRAAWQQAHPTLPPLASEVDWLPATVYGAARAHPAWRPAGSLPAWLPGAVGPQPHVAG
ncbi:MAG: polysaccharide lyase family 1 protein [Rubrivivax sp.]